MKLSDVEALAIVREAWKRVHGREPTTNELVFTTAIAKFETGYGRDGQHGELAARGLYNWGNLEVSPLPDGSCAPGQALGIDRRKDGTIKSVCFIVATSDVESAVRYIHTLTKNRPTVRAMATGSASAIVAAMKVSPAYFEGDAVTYTAGIDRIAKSLRPLVGGERTDVTLFLVLAAAAAWWLLRDRQ